MARETQQDAAIAGRLNVDDFQKLQIGGDVQVLDQLADFERGSLHIARTDEKNGPESWPGALSLSPTLRPSILQVEHPGECNEDCFQDRELKRAREKGGKELLVHVEARNGAAVEEPLREDRSQEFQRCRAEVTPHMTCLIGGRFRDDRAARHA